MRLGGIDHGARRLHRRGNSRGTVEDEDGVSTLVFEQDGQGVDIALRRRIADDVDGIAARPARRQRCIEPRDRFRRQLSQAAAEIEQRIGRENANAAAVGEDREPIARWLACNRERLGRLEQRLEVEHAQQAGALEGSVVYGIAAGERACMRGDRARRFAVPPRLDDDHRLQARRPPSRRHELPRIGHGFHVHEDGAGAGIAGEIVEHVAEVDVRHLSHGNQV